MRDGDANVDFFQLSLFLQSRLSQSSIRGSFSAGVAQEDGGFTRRRQYRANLKPDAPGDSWEELKAGKSPPYRFEELYMLGSSVFLRDEVY
jgi:hypothetical protein